MATEVPQTRSIALFLKPEGILQLSYVLVFPRGYRDSWKVVSEKSKADDRGFIESIRRIAPQSH